MYSFSTSWNYWRAKSGQEIIDEVLEIGLRKVELNFSLSGDLFYQVKKIVDRGEIEVTSLHNFCPLPLLTQYRDRTPDMFSLCSLSEDERILAVEHTQRTMDAARLVGAKAVVLHLGRVRLRKDRTHDLIILADQGQGQGRKANKIRDKFWRERRRKGTKHLEKVLKSLDTLNAYGTKIGIQLGLETRYGLCEFPTLEEFETILGRFKGGNIHYWHDVGHAVVKEYVGLEGHDDYLRRLGPYLLGWHIHDITGARDHQAPGCGNFNFKRLLPYLTAETINVLEPHHPATKEEVKRGFEFLQQELNVQDGLEVGKLYAGR